MKCRIVYRPEGVTVIHPVAQSREQGESEEDWLNRVFDKAMVSDQNITGLDFDDVDASTLPVSREFRDAWIGFKGLGVSVDPIKKQNIINDRLIRIEIAKDRSMRDQAINKLKASGGLPPTYVDPI